MHECVSEETHSAKDNPCADDGGHECSEGACQERTLLEAVGKGFKNPLHQGVPPVWLSASAIAVASYIIIPM